MIPCLLIWEVYVRTADVRRNEILQIVGDRILRRRRDLSSDTKGSSV